MNAKKLDLFLSYHSIDSDSAKSFAEHLEKHGFSVWFDKHDLLYGDDFIKKIEIALEDASAVAVLIGRSKGPWQQIEINAALIKTVESRRRVIPVLLPEAGDRPELPLFLRCFVWLDLRQGFDSLEPEKLRLAIGQTQIRKVANNKHISSLADSLSKASERIIISGHTLNKFVNDTAVRSVLLDALSRGVKLLITQLNPHCRYAKAHELFHELESISSNPEQYEKTLNFFAATFEDLTESQKECLEMVFVNYMPRFRTVIIDDEVHLYLYMYGVDVASEPDMVLKPPLEPKEELMRQNIIYSITKMSMAPESIPFIRCAVLNKDWVKTKLAKWDEWTNEERSHHRLTYNFYVSYAEAFDDRFGHDLEDEVSSHLDLLSGSTLVLGCGSGKEVEYIVKKRSHDKVLGIDFSYLAIDLAKKKHKDIRNKFLLGDFYDLDFVVPGSFDCIVANAAFVHLYKRDDIDILLRKIWDKLTINGRVFLRLLYKERDGIPIINNEEIDDSPEHIKDWGAPRWFIYFSRKELCKRCEAAGFTVLEKETSQIAKSVCKYGKSELKEILEKGFSHVKFRGVVYWPILLLQKSSPIGS